MKQLKKGFFICLGMLACLGLYLGYIHLTGNIHAIVKDEAYRSAQLSPELLGKTVHQYGIKTVLNLRGENTGSAWYDDEIDETRRLGITHVDFRMSAATELTFDEASKLIAIMKDAPKPLLIHCKAGADRTGLASALYMAAISKMGEEAAEQQISIRYGHFSLPFTSVFAMDRTFEMMEPSLGFPNS